MEDEKNPSLLHTMPMNTEKQSTSFIKKIIFFLVIALLGVGTGYGLAKIGGKAGIAQVANGHGIVKGLVVGTTDKTTFKDSAEGVLKTGGVQGEGQYHLERPGGISQNVYLTSSVVDLFQFVGRKVKVLGQTNQAEKAGWLMDVGQVEVIK